MANGLGIWSSTQETAGWYIKDTRLWSPELCKAIARAQQDIYKPVLMPYSHDSGWSNMAHQTDRSGSQHHYRDPSRDWTLPSYHHNLMAPNTGLHLHEQEGPVTTLAVHYVGRGRACISYICSYNVCFMFKMCWTPSPGLLCFTSTHYIVASTWVHHSALWDLGPGN